VYKDANNITKTSNHDVELVEFKYPVISQVYLDPVIIYMEKSFNRGSFSISSIFSIVRVYKILCGEDQVGNYSQTRVTDLFWSFIKDNERTKLLDQLLDWLHWHFPIT
jgi:hypothetical protein